MFLFYKEIFAEFFYNLPNRILVFVKMKVLVFIIDKT